MDQSQHPDEVFRIHERILAESSAEGRFIDIGDGQRLHVIEAGDGPPVLMLHGTGAAAHTLLPVIDNLEGFRAIAPDRPGFGLSDSLDGKHASLRQMALDVTNRLLDALGVEQVSLVGNSGGGLWGIWYALAHPERVKRLVLLGSVPLLPGTRPPIPLRLAATPGIGHIMSRLPANERMVRQLMGVLGEKDTIVKHPRMLAGLVAANNDPVASDANRVELAAMLTLRGFKADMMISAGDLARLTMPVLIIWGDHDPLGSPDVARALCAAIPDCTLEVLPAGHVPQLGSPEKSAQRIADFLRAA